MEIRFVFTGFSIKGQKVTINRSHSNTFGVGSGGGGGGAPISVEDLLI